jgi:hypothetical protein
MGHEDFADLEFTGLPDVASARLWLLLGEDPMLDKAVDALVALLKDPPEVMLGWSNLVTPRISSSDPSSTA